MTPPQVRRASLAVPCCNELGESPVWSVVDQALWWVDLRGRILHRLTTDSQIKTWRLPDLVCGVALAKRGVIIALSHSLSRFDPSTGTTTKLVEIEPPTCGNRLNELRSDRQGRLWVGSMRDFGAAISGSLYRVSATLDVDRVLTDVHIPNGLGWSPDGRHMFFADTGDGRLRSYSFDPISGTLGPVDIFAEAGSLPGRPDGATVDAAGGLWSARVGAGAIVRIDQSGAVTDIVETPASLTTSCALGGPHLRTLYITTARQRLSRSDLAIQPTAGGLFAINVDTPGVPESPFEH